MNFNQFFRRAGIAATLLVCVALCAAQQAATRITVHWDQVRMTSKTTPTLQVVVNPPLRRGTPVHDNAFKALRDLGADYVRYVPWLPYPRLAVAELQPPADGKTFWDFSVIDPMTIDFLDATEDHPAIVNFSTIPEWMYKTEKPVAYPEDPNQVDWNYEQGTELRNPSYKEVADYYARLLSWYTKGGFTDEAGKYHASGHHYSIPYWEVLNEVDFEHRMSPQTYTGMYDAIVTAMRQVQPDMKFVGAALAAPSANPAFFEYFLDPKNHKPGIPLDYISYHFYAVPAPDESLDIQQHTVFAQADGFLNTVRYVEAIRKRLSPATRTDIDEIGIISADDTQQNSPGHVTKPIASAYWNLAGAEYAYLFGQLTRLGIDIAGESQLVGFPTQYPSVSMVDWMDGKPNARFWVLKLLRDNFGPGDKLVDVSTLGPAGPYLYTLAALTPSGKRKLLIINKRDRDFELTLPGAAGAQVNAVDLTTGSEPASSNKMGSETLTIHGFSVAVVTLN